MSVFFLENDQIFEIYRKRHSMYFFCVKVSIVTFTMSQTPAIIAFRWRRALNPKISLRAPTSENHNSAECEYTLCGHNKCDIMGGWVCTHTIESVRCRCRRRRIVVAAVAVVSHRPPTVDAVHIAHAHAARKLKSIKLWRRPKTATHANERALARLFELIPHTGD